MKINIFTIETFNYDPINNIDAVKLENLKKDIEENGILTPIYYCNLGLLTGSHRIEVLRTMNDIYEFQAIDFTDEVNQYCEMMDCSYNELQFDDINDLSVEEVIKYFRK